MSLRCQNPELQTTLLREARHGAELSFDLAQHLEGCASCQSEVERKRRMASVWAGDAPTEEEVDTALRRFHARRQNPVRHLNWTDVVPFGAAGAAASYVLLLVTHTVPLPWKSAPHASAASETALLRTAPVYAITEEDKRAVLTRPHVETTHGVAPLVQGLRIELKRGESARVSLANGKASTVDGPCLVEFWSAPLEVGGFTFSREERAASDDPSGSRGAVAAGSPSSQGAPNAETSRDETLAPATPHGEALAAESRTDEPGRAPDEAVTKKRRDAVARALPNAPTEAETRALAGEAANPAFDKAWARAAAALNADDFTGADRAFSELGQALDPATRDAARLARAQLWIAHGRGDAVRPVLEQLAQSGATPLVRRSAAEFLARSSH